MAQSRNGGRTVEGSSKVTAFFRVYVARGQGLGRLA